MSLPLVIKRKQKWELLLYFSLAILHSPLLEAQRAPADTWIGVHAKWEDTFFCPLPTYLDLRPDSTLHLGMTDNGEPPKTARWSLRNDTLQLDSLVYPPKLWRIEGNFLRFGLLYPMVFRRLTGVPLNAQFARKQLIGRIWQTDSLLCQFYDTGKVCLQNPRTGEQTVHCWQTVQRGPSVFLVMRGNQYTCDDNYKPMLQLTRIGADSFSAIGWNGRQMAEVPFRFMRALSAGDSCRSTGFQPCDNCLSVMCFDTGHERERTDVPSQKNHESAVSGGGLAGAEPDSDAVCRELLGRRERTYVDWLLRNIHPNDV